MHRLVALLLACSGCDGLFGLTRDGYSDAATSDALDGRPIDGDGARPCAGRSPVPLFCFDFDGPTLAGYQNGVEFPLQVMTQGVIVDRRAPAATGERALWMTSVGTGYAFAYRDDPFKAFHQISARLSLRGTTTTAVMREQEIVRIAVEGGGSCHAVLVLEASAMLQFQISCGGSTVRGSLGTLTDAWHRYELAFDANTGQGTASVDGGAPTTLTVIATQASVQPPAMMFGLIGSDEGVTVGFDDIDVTGM